MIRPILLSASVVGLLGGHFLGYLAAVPNESSRHSVLVNSGHAYLGAALVFALLAALITLVGSVWLGYRKRLLSFGGVAVRLAIMQTSSYLVMELAERWIAGGSFQAFPKLLALGLLAQVAVALLAATVVVLITRVGYQIRRSMSARKRRVPDELGRPSEIRPTIRSKLLDIRAARGPPQPHTI